MTTTTFAQKSSPMVRVWDPLVRIFHWGLVLSFLVAWVSAEGWDDLHETAGFVAAGLIAFRLLWGLVGSRFARFSQFVKGPGAVFAYLKDIARGRERRYLGHNPAGAAMIVILLLGMIGTAGSGWMMTLPDYHHVRWVKELHETISSIMLALIALHLGGVILASWRHRENLVKAMITGQKRAGEDGDVG